jgi:hypothetical protein
MDESLHSCPFFVNFFALKLFKWLVNMDDK